MRHTRTQVSRSRDDKFQIQSVRHCWKPNNTSLIYIRKTSLITEMLLRAGLFLTKPGPFVTLLYMYRYNICSDRTLCYIIIQVPVQYLVRSDLLLHYYTCTSTIFGPIGPSVSLYHCSGVFPLMITVFLIIDKP